MNFIQIFLNMSIELNILLKFLTCYLPLSVSTQNMLHGQGLMKRIIVV